MRMIKILLIGLMLQACGGADEANVDSQVFIDDFGVNYLFFFDNCHTTLATKEGSNVYTLNKGDGFIINLHGLDRQVVKNVGIEYQTDNFELWKYFDNRIVIRYDDVECTIHTYDIGL